MTRAEERIKRAIDVACSAAAIGALWPLGVAIAVAVKLDSRGPILFRQKRLGRNARVFEIAKFRTMRQGSPVVIGPDKTVANPLRDDRVTRVGAVLRRTSLDELPQLLNVLAGEMSLVGPRPDLPEALGLYQGAERAKLDVKPGITGLAQISGRNLLAASAKWALDVRYAKEASLRLDLEILVATVLKVMRAEGVYRVASAQGSSE